MYIVDYKHQLLKGKTSNNSRNFSPFSTDVIAFLMNTYITDESQADNWL